MFPQGTQGTGNLFLNVNIHNRGTRYDGTFPKMTHPEPIGYYSINGGNQLCDDASNASYLYIPPANAFPLDLKEGIRHAKRKVKQIDYKDMHILCDYIYRHKNLMRTSSKGQLVLLDMVVTFRGVLRQIMCTPYDSEDYTLAATRFNNTIYISKVEWEMDGKTEPTNNTDMCSWGFKFEQYCTTNYPGVKPDTSVPVDETKEFACVYRTTISHTSLLYAAEMDCIESDVCLNLKDPHQLRAAKFIELKTSFDTTNNNSFNRYKSLKWWCQSFLVGIPTILAGLRKNDGLVHRIREYRVSELHRQKPWSPAAAATFLTSFLEQLQRLLDSIDDTEPFVMLDFVGNSRNIYYTVVREDKPNLLPEWYRRSLNAGAHKSHQKNK